MSEQVTVNALTKMVSEKASGMVLSNAVRFCYEVGKMDTSAVELKIGRYVPGKALMMMARVDGKRLDRDSDCQVAGLLQVNEYYKRTYLTPEWREIIKAKLNENKALVLQAIRQ